MSVLCGREVIRLASSFSLARVLKRSTKLPLAAIHHIYHVAECAIGGADDISHQRDASFGIHPPAALVACFGSEGLNYGSRHIGDEIGDHLNRSRARFRDRDDTGLGELGNVIGQVVGLPPHFVALGIVGLSSHGFTISVRSYDPIIPIALFSGPRYSSARRFCHPPRTMAICLCSAAGAAL